MNSPVLHDLELPPAPLPDYVWWLLALLVLLLLIAGLVWWRKWQHPVARALRQLERLPDSPPNPTALATILRTALKNPSPQPRTQPLSASSLKGRGAKTLFFLAPPRPLRDDPVRGWVRGLGGEGFFKRLEHARFSPTPCTLETFATLKREARTLLEQAR